MIKDRYARGVGTEVIDIEDLRRAKLDKPVTYERAGCSETLVPRLGDGRAHHFAHKVEGNCSFESYLH
ncbi:MAG: hypothetical protein Roseis2KO_41560 [Roseivirga sp.]